MINDGTPGIHYDPAYSQSPYAQITAETEAVIVKSAQAVVRAMLGTELRLRLGTFVAGMTGEEMGLQLSAHIAANDTTEERQTVEVVPLTWWDHLKQTINQKFGTKFRYATREIATRLTYNTRRCCPHTNLPFEREPQIHLSFLKMKGANPWD